MIAGPFHAETITLTRSTPGPPDEDGVPTTTVVTVEVPGCNVQPYVIRGGTEVVTNTDQVTDRYSVSCPLGSGIDENDRITWRGDEYLVWGKPQDYHTAVHRLDHTEFFMTRFLG